MRAKESSTLAQNLTQLMRKAQYSLGDVERGTLIPKATLQRWKAEGAKPRVEVRLLDLAKFFGVELAQLLFGDCSKVSKVEIKLISQRIEGRTVYGKLIDHQRESGQIIEKPSLSLPLKQSNASECKSSEAFKEGA